MDVIDEARAHPSGRLDGVVLPSTIDKMTLELLVESRAEASTRDLSWTTHTSQSVLEFNIMVDRHGISPTPFMRSGTTLESLERHLDAGLVLGIGTDTIPHNFIEDMRSAAILARVAEHDGNTAKTGDVFHAGTAGGAKADIVVIDCNHPMMLPSRDPLMCLIHSAADCAVKDVYIDGMQTVRDHERLTLDRQVAAEKIVDGQARMETAVEGTDFLGRTSQEIAPLSLPVTEPG
jgi:5-methylthioadenosine/S-adenosylhomocysteine deaminase